MREQDQEGQRQSLRIHRETNSCGLAGGTETAGGDVNHFRAQLTLACEYRNFSVRMIYLGISLDHYCPVNRGENFAWKRIIQSQGRLRRKNRSFALLAVQSWKNSASRVRRQMSKPSNEDLQCARRTESSRVEPAPCCSLRGRKTSRNGLESRIGFPRRQNRTDLNPMPDGRLYPAFLNNPDGYTLMLLRLQ
jgi:hypothetical protein